MSSRALIIDDDDQIRRSLRVGLRLAQWEVIEAPDGQTGLVEVVHKKPDVVIVDLGLPDIHGIEIIRRLREWTDVPILVLSVLDSDADKIGAFEAGADDYLSKPFSDRELLACLKVLLRLRRGEDRASRVSFGKVVVDIASRSVTKDGLNVQLTQTEFALLSILAINNGKVVTHRQILKSLWGPSTASNAQYLRVYMNRLRRKLEDDPNSPVFLRTEPGIGYRLQVHDA